MLTDEQRATLWNEILRWSASPTPSDEKDREANVTTYVKFLIAQARAEAFEECAKVCDNAICVYNSNEQDMLAKQLAFLIRARKDAP